MQAASMTTTQDRRNGVNTPRRWRISTIESSKTSESNEQHVYDGVHALSAFSSERANGACRMHFHGAAQDMCTGFTACRAAYCTLELYISSRAGFVVIMKRLFSDLQPPEFRDSQAGHVELGHEVDDHESHHFQPVISLFRKQGKCQGRSSLRILIYNCQNCIISLTYHLLESRICAETFN